MGDKLANILAQSFRVNLKFQLDISAKLASGLKKLRHQMNVFLGILTKRAWNPNFTRLHLITHASVLL